MSLGLESGVGGGNPTSPLGVGGLDGSSVLLCPVTRALGRGLPLPLPPPLGSKLGVPTPTGASKNASKTEYADEQKTS